MRIPFSPPDISEKEIEEVVCSLKSGWITTGPRTKEFERKIADYCGTERAVCLNSATACMELTLRVLGIGPGDEVIVPAYTYTATASVVCHVGATLIMVDTAADSFEMDYEQLEQAITERTKVIIPVDLAGVLCDYEKIFRIVEKKKKLFCPTNNIQRVFGRIVVMSDAAHAFGACLVGNNGEKKYCGSIADFTSFSFHAVKNLTTAEGGAVTWRSREGLDNEAVYKEYMLLSLHGQSKDALAKTKLGAWEYDIVAPYYKCNMTDIMAAIGLKQLERYDDLCVRRREIVRIYDKVISNWNETHDRKLYVLEHIAKNRISSCHLYLLRIAGFSVSDRNRLIEKVAEAGIATNVHYKPLPLLTAYKDLGFDIKDYPNAYGLYENEITLPLHTLLTEEDVTFVINTVLDIVKNMEN